MLVYCVLYHFTFEMNLIKLALENSSLEGFKNRKSYYSRIKWTLISYVIFSITIISAIIFYRIVDVDNYKNHMKALNYLQLSLKTLKFFSDIYVYILFIMVFKFFIYYRRLRNAEPYKKQ